MIDLLKWNYETHEYDPYQVPDDWVLGLYSTDMELPINCAQCGKGMTYGVGYTSKEVHTPVGFGYAVCEQCYEKEVERDREARARP